MYIKTDSAIVSTEQQQVKFILFKNILTKSNGLVNLHDPAPIFQTIMHQNMGQTRANLLGYLIWQVSMFLNKTAFSIDLIFSLKLPNEMRHCLQVDSTITRFDRKVHLCYYGPNHLIRYPNKTPFKKRLFLDKVPL